MVDDFLTYGAGAGWSAGTLRLYGWHLRRFAGWCEAAGVELASVGRSDVRRWAASLTAWGPATRRGACIAVRSFLRWCGEEGAAPAGCAAWVPVPVVRSSVQRTISPSEVGALLDACRVVPDRGVSAAAAMAVSVRNAAIVAVLYDSLVRASELCRLDVGDIDLRAGRLLVRRGKGGVARWAVFSRECAGVLAAWLEVRSGLAVSCAAAFVSLGGSARGGRLTSRGLRVIVRRIGERAGIAGVSPHAFRRGGAVAATLNGAPGRLVQSWAGWSSSRMLDVYTRALEGSSDAYEAFAAYSPLSRVDVRDKLRG